MQVELNCMCTAVSFSLCLFPFILEDMMVYYKRNLLIVTLGVLASCLFIE